MTLNNISPAHWGYRINRLHLYKRIGPPPNECSVYVTKQSDGEAPVMLELWRMWRTPLLPSLPGPFLPGVVAPDRVLLMGEIELLWEPYQSHYNGLFSPLLVQRFQCQKSRSISVLSEQYETSYLFNVTLSFLCNIMLSNIRVCVFISDPFRGQNILATRISNKKGTLQQAKGVNRTTY